jgi:hypothetical protein
MAPRTANDIRRTITLCQRDEPMVIGARGHHMMAIRLHEETDANE